MAIESDEVRDAETRADSEPAVSTAGARDKPLLPSQPPRPLSHEDRYETVELLGQGGMGTVALCLDRQIGRRVAMKTMRKPSRGSEVRFVREARIQGQLEHPALVPVYDLGVDPAGNVFFTMRRVRGATLRAILRGLREGAPGVAEKYSLRRLLTALSSVCLALDFAHRRGVLHRDVKPGNLMLGDFGEVYLLDWGVARVLGEDEREEGSHDEVIEAPSHLAEVTRAGALVGTIGYVAPEQVLRETVGPTADVYALGTVLFEILTLQRLHPIGDSDAAESTLLGNLAPPSARTPDRGIAPELDAICARATERHPERRYPTARAMHEDIERFLDGQRDDERRRELAEAHSSDAADAIASSGGRSASTADARRRAMRAVGRSLALDPGNRKAMRVLTDLLSAPPREVPEEVARAVEERYTDGLRWAARVSSVAYLSLILYLPLVVWAGVRDAAAVALFYGLVVASAAAGLWCGFGPRTTRASARLVIVIGNAMAAASAVVLGAFLLTPGFVAINAMASAVAFDRRDRVWALASGALAIVAPIAYELAIEHRYSFEAGRLSIAPGAIVLDALPVLALLTAGSVATVVSGVLATARLRQTLSAAELQLQLQAWQLRELAPGIGEDRDGDVSRGARSAA
jgi:serine/threonine protein kinase